MVPNHARRHKYYFEFLCYSENDIGSTQMKRSDTYRFFPFDFFLVTKSFYKNLHSVFKDLGRYDEDMQRNHLTLLSNCG